MLSLLLIWLNVYFVTFTDKSCDGEPALSPRAVEQRAKWNIPTDELDYPVNASYVTSLQDLGATVFHTSRWFNGATCEMTNAIAAQVEALSFVANVEMTRDNSSSQPFWRPKRQLEDQADPITPGELHTNEASEQLSLYNLLPLHKAGFEGQGILMTVCDGGFYNANTLSCFRQSQLELGHFDFTDDDDDFYGSSGTHGTECLSAISGKMQGYKGAATKAPYYLMRAEENGHESPKEADNLVAAFEKADSLGVNVFSVSLGYYIFDNSSWDMTQDQLDGRTARVSRAATIAARKGLLICVAAGNEGDNSWRSIITPADADSILSVGAVYADGSITYFSSYGPSADGRVKPEVCAVGGWTKLISPYGQIIESNGTSFATPLMAGLAATLWSALPNESAMQIRERIIRSADRYEDPDMNQYGYGIPNAWKAYTMELPEGLEEQEADDQTPTATKILRKGQIFILRHGHVYTLSGQRVH